MAFIRLDGSIQRQKCSGLDVVSIRSGCQHLAYTCVAHKDTLKRLLGYDYGETYELGLTKEYIKGQYSAIRCDYHNIVVSDCRRLTNG